jgi:mannosyltransferase OCH1-like enzyme
MPAHDPLEESHRKRSNFVRGLVQRSISPAAEFSESTSKPPQRIVQFWDDLNRLPGDVGECIATWKKAEKQGLERSLFDKHQAREFIHQRLGRRYKEAYDKCYHPAMQSDYFRLCYIFMEGGCYIDADDVYSEAPIRQLFGDGRLKIQPLCYDMATNMMVPPSLFTKPDADASGWIFYFNNNPLIAGCGHPLIDHA